MASSGCHVIDRSDLQRWLYERVGEPRRLVRSDAEFILVSKFDAGIVARLHDRVARIPELLDDEAVSPFYRKLASQAPNAERVQTWHDVVAQLVNSLGREREIGTEERAEIMAGLDSVAALLASVLWSSPIVSDDYVPASGEMEAYQDVVAGMDARRVASS